MSRRWAVLILLTACAVACRESERWISKTYKFTPLRPPSSLLAPGAVIMKGGDKNDSTRLVCSAAESFGPAFRPSHSRTLTGRFSKRKKIGWRMSADLLSQAKGQAAASDVSDVYVEVTSARIDSIADTDALKAIPYRSKACRYAMARRIEGGFELSVVKAALICDLTYRIQFETNSTLDAEARIQQVQNLSVALGGNIESASDTQASAKGLVFGIRDDTFLAAIDADDADIRKLKRKSLLTTNEVLERQISRELQRKAIEDASQGESDASDGAQWSAKPVASTDDEVASPLPSPAPAYEPGPPALDVTHADEVEADFDDDTGYPG